jgi:hypothetical protein
MATTVAIRLAGPSAWGPIRSGSPARPDEDEDREQEHRVERLGADEDRDERRAGEQHDRGRDDSVGRVEGPGLPPGVVEPSLDPERLRDGVGRGQWKDRGRQERCAEQAGSEQRRREATGQRLEGAGGVGRVVDPLAAQRGVSRRTRPR